MRTPSKYSDLTLPLNLPQKRVKVVISDLPVIGYIEQSVGQSISDALLALGSFRPKHPFKSPTKSANEYCGLFLKTNNIESKDFVRKRYGLELELFESRCSLMVWLSTEIERSGEPTDDFKQKVESFLSSAVLK